MNEFTLLDAAADAMSAQRTILDLAARNVAAAQAAVPGHPYQRLVASFAPAPPDDLADVDPAAADDAAGDADETFGGPNATLRITREAGTGDALDELIAALDAQRAYEANASIFDIGKRLAERTLDIER